MDDVLTDLYDMLLARVHFEKVGARMASSILDSVSAMERNHSPYCPALEADFIAFRGEIEKTIHKYVELLNDFSATQFNFFDHFLLRSRTNYCIGRLYERMGDRRQAVMYYRKVLDRWKNADTELPEMIHTRRRLSELTE